VLIANPAPETRRQLADLLRREGYEPVEVEEGEAALHAIEQGAADVALLDLLLPGRGALDILPEARRSAGSLPILITGTLSASPVQQIIGLYGADGYLTLPTNRDDLLAVLHRVRGMPPPVGDTPAASPPELPPPPTEPGPATPSLAGPAGGGLMVLLVEDHSHIRFLVRELLLQGGFGVLTAADGVEAVDVAEGHAGPIDLLLTDVLMPRMTGPRLYEHLAARRPGLKVLYLTGLPTDELLARGVLKEEAPLVQKPFQPTELMAKVGEVLSVPARSSE
jgi:CheY-like chemotaxis protein